ncbi:NADH:flavin oxidoreductase/NADH oxidase [Novosphingobium sp. AP12]|uniref:NADH:flavin oxidoreductase/NADH oxidase n=1 Tax=Novosphingobium sp. AP12 TaxID=1144305 RepID=UPI000271E224|nr:NADH:flavin oxidoreductase/NADH oxidase [Novosphingobium sp. AP12]EJL33409.1 NADH:flavin oxidoreductase [Novosphingobium sp. AP12]
MLKPKLFEPIRVANLDLANRIIIAPMCQYSAEDGCMTDWHRVHLGSLALSGAAMLTIEATAVVPEGRISYADVGLYDDNNEIAMGSVLDTLRKVSEVPIAVQLSHAGRKASQEKPWLGGGQISPVHAQGWQTVAPSAVAFKPSENAPNALSTDDLREIRDAFAASALRAANLGLNLIQLHGAHGYLLHQFLSPLSNKRTDEYGGSLENRMRFPLEVFDAVREKFPSERPISFRISADDWVPGGLEIEQSIAVAEALEARGCDAIHVSSGGLHSDQAIPVGPSYQVSLASAVKQAVKMPVIAVGLITSPEQAESILATGQADMIALARTITYDPRWPWHAAAALGTTVPAPGQYLRSEPNNVRGLFRSA